MKALLIIFPGNEVMGEKISKGLQAEKGEVVFKNFPDGESYIRLITDVLEKEVIVVATLHRPDDKFLALVFLLRLLKEAGAANITLVAPYLAYMRQDKQFKPGEAVTSTYFGELLSPFIDELITVDPHLHRRHSMSELYKAPIKVVHAAEKISHWIKNSVPNAVLIGPDSESEQWVSTVASEIHVPYIILEKRRHGDTDVEISLPAIDMYKDFIPVLLDDIISTAHTMMETSRQLRQAGFKPAICIGVHAVFAGDSYNELGDSGVSQIVTCNTIPHESNEIDISPLIIESLNDRSR